MYGRYIFVYVQTVFKYVNGTSHVFFLLKKQKSQFSPLGAQFKISFGGPVTLEAWDKEGVNNPTFL